MIRNLTTVSLLCESMRGRTRVWARACLNPGILIVHTFALEVVMVLMLIVCGFGWASRVRGAPESFATSGFRPPCIVSCLRDDVTSSWWCMACKGSGGQESSLEYIV